MDGRIYQGVGRKMIEVKSKNGLVKLKVSGEIKTILADLMIIISSVYEAITEEHPEKEADLKAIIRSCVNSDLAFEKHDGEADD